MIASTFNKIILIHDRDYVRYVVYVVTQNITNTRVMYDITVSYITSAIKLNCSTGFFIEA